MVKLRVPSRGRNGGRLQGPERLDDGQRQGIEVQTSGTIGPLAAQHGSYHAKIVQLPTEVPLPATGVLLLAGPGVLGARHLCRSAKP